MKREYSKVKNKTTNRTIYVKTELIKNEEGLRQRIEGLEALISANEYLKLYNEKVYVPVARIVLNNLSTELPYQLDLVKTKEELKSLKGLHEKAKADLQHAIQKAKQNE